MIGMKYDFTGIPFELVPFVADISYIFHVKSNSATRPLEPIFLGIRFLDPTFRHNTLKSTVRFLVTETHPLFLLSQIC